MLSGVIAILCLFSGMPCAVVCGSSVISTYCTVLCFRNVAHSRAFACFVLPLVLALVRSQSCGAQLLVAATFDHQTQQWFMPNPKRPPARLARCAR